MIYRETLNSENSITGFFGPEIRYYPPVIPNEVVETVDYVVKSGDTFYTIGLKLFGSSNQHLWPIIAEQNGAKMEHELQPGETIKLPIVIVNK